MHTYKMREHKHLFEKALVETDRLVSVKSCLEQTDKGYTCTDQTGHLDEHRIAPGLIEAAKTYRRTQSSDSSSDTLTSWQIQKNLVVTSLVMILIYTSYSSLARIQSSLHGDEGLGTICYGLSYLSNCLISLLLAKLVVSYIGHKWSITMSLLGFILWVAVNGFACWTTLIPVSLLVGAVTAVLWISQTSYLAILAKYYAEQKDMAMTHVVSIFLGVFYLAFETGMCHFEKSWYM